MVPVMASHTETEPEFIGSAEVCRQYAVHASTVSRWVAAGELTPAHKLPGRNGAFVFRRSDVVNFFDGRAEATA